MDDKKRSAFTRLAERRTNAVLEKVRLLGNLSNPYAYEYTDEEVKRIFGAIETELRATRGKFQGRNRERFRLE